MNEFITGDGTHLPVKVRISTRAKRLRLSLSFTGELEVVVPRQLSKKMGAPGPIQDFLEQHRPWIERAARRSQPQRETYRESKAAGLPTHLEFPICDELWLVEYRQTQAQGVTAKSDGLRRIQGTRKVFSLRISGAILNEDLCRRVLIRFVTQRAKQTIPGFAWEICRELNVRPASIAVNNRKSAWGVCTRSGDIRIDRRVMFLPRDLARQIVLHEVAHLKHLNHSQRFYDELLSYEGSTKEAEKAVKSAVRYVPAWFISGYNQGEAC